MKLKKIAALGLCLALMLTLSAGCAKQGGAADPTPTPVETPTPTPEQTPSAERTEVNLAVLKGPTGIGAAKLLADNDAGTTLNHYNVTVGSDPANDVAPQLVKGDFDIAALPTNMAANLFHKTKGGVQLLALNTLGVLYILENGNSVSTLADLKGKTLIATGQGANPEYVLNYLLEQNGLDPATDVDIQWKASDEVAALMASGEAELCMLPVPAATSVLMQNADVRAAVDLNDAWKDVGAAGTFTMGCIVVRTEFAQQNPQAVQDFLTEYALSIDYVNKNVDAAAELVAQYEITPKAAIAKAAIPQANLVCITGEDMYPISDYYEVLAGANPDAIGGSIPDDSFYYIP